MDEFQVNLPDILAAQEEFKAKIAAMQASDDAIKGIMQSLGGAPDGAGPISGVQGMLDALKRLEEDVASLPSDVGSDLGGIGGAGTVDDSHHGPGEGHGHGPGSGMGNQGSGNSGGNNAGGNSGMNPNSPENQTGDPAETSTETTTETATGEPIGPDLPPGGNGGTAGTGAGAGAAAGGVFAMPFAMGQQNQGDDEEEEEEEEAPEYVSAVNAPLKKELDEKAALLSSAQENLQTVQNALDEKQDRLSRLEAAFAANHDPKLADRINQLRAEVSELNASLNNDMALVDTLKVEVDALAKRWSYIDLPPDANLEKIRALEGGETSQWIKDATRNEDNSVNCVNYVVNRVPIPGELPLNAHLWDEQATKFADELGIKIGDVPLEGAIIVMEREHSYANDVYGHVMYVEKVENGIVWVTDNTYPDRMVRLDHLTDELSGPYIKYLYLPWQVVA